MKYSIIIVTHNSLYRTIECIESVFAFTKNFELIIVDNGSTDGTVGYLSEMAERHDNFTAIFNKANRNFSGANNQGIKAAKGEFVVILNNDTVVNEQWLERLTNCFEHAPYKNIGIVGPVSNCSAGRQMVGHQGDPKEWHLRNRGTWIKAGRLYGWCMLMRKSFIEEMEGFDERFENSFEDNDLCLRAQLAGYSLVIAVDTYITHAGQATFEKIMDVKAYMKNGDMNQKKFYDKWQTQGRKKLVAVYRTNGGEHLEESLRQTSRFADAIVIHFCRARRNVDDIRHGALLKEFPKIMHTEFYDGIFQEDYERNRLIEIALQYHVEGNADWCISIDDDEIYEDRFIDQAQAMMNPRNPEIFGYWCQWKTIWKRSGETEFFRADSTFGRFSNYRLFRLIPGQEITSHGHPEGHHCGSAPVIPAENLRWSKIRVKHLGYDTPEQRRRKYEFYRDNDHFPSQADIGNKDYTHLIDEDVELKEYDPLNGISLVMIVKNEEDVIRKCLEHIAPAIDEVVIVDTGSTDKTKEIVTEFAEHSAVPVKLLDFKWADNFSLARNFAKSHATKKWILHLDADEMFEDKDIPELVRMSEEDCDAYVFHVINYLQPTAADKPPVYASSDSLRLFRNLSDLYYTGLVHESLDDAMAARNGRDKTLTVRATISLHHRGYLKRKEKVMFKFMDYTRLNERQIEITEGLDPRPYCSLALHWLQDGDQDKSIDYFQKAIALSPYNWHANTQMAALNLKAAKQFLKNALVTLPEGGEVRDQVKKVVAFLDAYHFGHYRIDFNKPEEESCLLPAKT